MAHTDCRRAGCEYGCLRQRLARIAIVRANVAGKYRMDVAPDAQDPLISLVHAAVGSDDPAQLIAVAQPELGQPLGLVGAGGHVLGHAPDTDGGRRALAIARAAATSRLVAPPGWIIVPIAGASSPLGFLAVGAGAETDRAQERLLDLVAQLLADQLRRLALLEAHTAAFVQRLVSAPAVGVGRARRDADDLGLALADSYWPALLVWRSTTPRAEVVDRVAGEARGSVEGSLATVLGGRMVLLHPGADRVDHSRFVQWLGQRVARAQSMAPSSRPQAIAGDGPVAVGELSAHVVALDALWQLGPRADEEQPVLSARDFALDRLLQSTADTREAGDFVDEQLGRLIAWDREHHTDLLKVLEAALDYPRHDLAASRCFMHRNTFRHRYKQATELLDHSLDAPDVRLAVHVALKLRKLLAWPASHDVAGLRRAGAGSRRAGLRRDGAGPWRAPRAGERRRASASRR
jgi:DNA-binding PucR family transcriptional regulator